MHTVITKSWHGRFPSKAINVGEVGLGGKYPIRLQSMTNTNTLNISETVDQCLRIIEAGADFVRISVPNKKSAESLNEIRELIRSAGYRTPIIADIHFNPNIALIAARIADKIRINPGNYSTRAGFDLKAGKENDYENELERINEKITPLLLVCKEYGTAIRIGTNHGSLSPRILHRYGNTAEGMVQATLEYIRIFEDHGFYNTVISIKSSDPLIMINAYRLMCEKLYKHKINYPLHLGVTEAGTGDEGRIRSAIGICSLLTDGIGDTIRISLSENPEHEIPFAKKITNAFEKYFIVSEDKKTKFSEPEKFSIINKIRKKIPENPFKQPIVISSCDELNNNNEEDKQQFGNDQQPDFVFCNSLKIPGIQNFILPFSLWKKHNAPQTFPLLGLKEIKEAKNIKSPYIFFDAKPDEITKKEIRSIYSVKGSVLIISTSNETNTRDIIELISNICHYGPVPIILKYSTNQDDWEKTIIEVSRMPAYLINEMIINGLWLDLFNKSLKHKSTFMAFSLLQSTGIRIATTQYISCPTCARTTFNMPQILTDVKNKTQHFKGLKIAVMGCVVNGPGEMAGADYGLVGAGNNKIHVYKKQQIIKKNIEEKNAVSILVNLIEKEQA